MRLPDFYAALQQGDLPTVATDKVPRVDPAQCETEREQLAKAILAVDEAVRLDRPEAFPALDPACAIWAVETLRGLWFVNAGEVAACPGDADDPRTHYAVDLVFRHLPRALAAVPAGSALADAVRRLACTWPLSAVIVAGAVASDPAPVLADPALRRAYGERILRQPEDDRPQDAGTLRCLEQLLEEHRAFATEVLAHHEELIRRPDL